MQKFEIDSDHTELTEAKKKVWSWVIILYYGQSEEATDEKQVNNGGDATIASSPLRKSFHL